MHSNNFNILSQTSVTSVLSSKFTLFWSKIHFFGWLKKNSVKCLFKFIFKDSYRIRTAGSQTCLLILFKHVCSSFKKKESKGIFWQTHWISFCSNQCHKLLAKVIFFMEWSWKSKTCKLLSLKWGTILDVVILYCQFLLKYRKLVFC